MNQLPIQHQLPSFFIGERRKRERFQDVHLLVVTNRGTGKIVDIHRQGLSFGCLFPHTFPEIFTVDILNAKGLHLKRVTVRKIWQRLRGDEHFSDEFELEIGAEFLALLPGQKDLLARLLAGPSALELLPLS